MRRARKRRCEDGIGAHRFKTGALVLRPRPRHIPRMKPALVTGASRGLGAAIAEALAATRPIVAVARTTGALEELDDRIRALGGTATLAPMDIGEPMAMQQLCLSIHERWGGLSAWIHCAIHAPPLSPAAHVADLDAEKTHAVNVLATQRLVTYVAPLLAEDGTAVFFDDAGAVGARNYALYGSSKAAQIAIARAWAAESTAPRVIIHEPAPMPTALRARFHPGENREALTPCADEAAKVMELL